MSDRLTDVDCSMSTRCLLMMHWDCRGCARCAGTREGWSAEQLVLGNGCSQSITKGLVDGRGGSSTSRIAIYVHPH